MESKNIQAYKKSRLEALEIYKNTHKVFSPALNNYVYFTAEGFNHLVFKKSRELRNTSEQRMRFSLLPLGIRLINLSTTYQEFEKRTKEMSIYYWGVVAILDGRKIKIVIRKNGNSGILHFWSVIPAWKMRRRRDAKLFNIIKDK
jgi:hypothetical protein